MSENKNVSSGGWGMLGWGILWAAVAYFVYGHSIDAAIAVFVLNAVMSLLLVISLIPLAGFPLYWWVQGIASEWVFAFTGITASWVTDLIITVTLIEALIIWIMISVFVIIKLIER